MPTSLTEQGLEWAVVVLPTLLGILGLSFALKVPHASTHRHWQYFFVLAGVSISVMTFFQQRHSRGELKAQIDNLQDQRRAVERLQQAVELGDQRQSDDLNRLIQRFDAANRTRVGSIVKEYAAVQRTKETLTNRELRQRALEVARKMAEFQFRYDFEGRQIEERDSKRFSQAIRDYETRLRKIEATPMTVSQYQQAEPQNNKDAKSELDKKLTDLNEQQKVLENNRKERNAAFKAFQKQHAQSSATANEERKSLAEKYVTEFRSSLLGEASYVRDQILSRLALKAKSPPTPETASVLLAFQGVLPDSKAVGSASHYLDGLARQLGP